VVLLLDDVVNRLVPLQLGSWLPHLPVPPTAPPEAMRRRWQAEMDAGGSGTHSSLLGLEATYAELGTPERVGLAMQAQALCSALDERQDTFFRLGAKQWREGGTMAMASPLPERAMQARLMARAFELSAEMDAKLSVPYELNLPGVDADEARYDDEFGDESDEDDEDEAVEEAWQRWGWEATSRRAWTLSAERSGMAFAFCMVRHGRLGAESVWSRLPAELLYYVVRTFVLEL